MASRQRLCEHWPIPCASLALAQRAQERGLLSVLGFDRVLGVDSTLTDQSSILRFVEDNRLGGQRIANAFDALAGSLNGMLDLSKPAAKPLFLAPATGAVASHAAAPKAVAGDGHGRH